MEVSISLKRMIPKHDQTSSKKDGMSDYMSGSANSKARKVTRGLGQD